MHALIVLSHPEPCSFNAALKDVATQTLRRAGHTVEISDLYGERFEPVEAPERFAGRADPAYFSALGEQRHASRTGTLAADLQREIARLDRADLVILQFPLWWHAEPAVLKGWFDRVFVNGGLYTSSKRYDRGHFRGKRAILSVTTGAPAAAFGPEARGGDMELMLWPIHYSLYYVGFSVLPPFVAHGIQSHGYAYAGDDEAAQLRAAYRQEWSDRLGGIAAEPPLRFPGWADWDDLGRRLTSAGTGTD